MKFSALGLLAYHLIFFPQLVFPLLTISIKISELERDLSLLGQHTKKSSKARQECLRSVGNSHNFFAAPF